MNKLGIKRTFAYILAIFLIVGILSLIYGVICFFAEILNNNIKNNVKIENNVNTEVIDVNFEKENIKKLDIDLNYTDLNILKGEELKFESSDKSIDIKEENNEIKIAEKNINSKISFGINNKKNTLNIYVPENMKFENVKISAGVGTIEIENLKTDNLKLEGGVGNIFIKTKVDNMAKIEAGVGKINLNILNDPKDINLKIERGLGQIYFNDNKLEEEQIGDGKVKFEIEGGVGKIEIFNK